MGKSFGEVVSYYLGALGVSQSELARRMGTGRQTVNSIIGGADALGARAAGCGAG